MKHEPVHIVTNDNKLSECVAFLADCKAFGIDLEFDKNRIKYGFNLCLIQVYAKKQCYLIDPLSDQLSLSPLFELLENETIQKIVFAFSEDLRLLYCLNCKPKNMFDLSLAAKLLNYDQPSLSKLIEVNLGVVASKSQQLSNWYNRPLSDLQKEYAVNDVKFLEDLKEILLLQSERKGITGWIRQENQSLDDMVFSPETLYKEKEKNNLNQVEWHLYRKLLEFREVWAKKLNKPSFQILNKDFLREIAVGEKKVTTWCSSKGINHNLKSKKIQRLVMNLIQSAKQETQELGLSTEKNAQKKLSRDNHRLKMEERSKVERIKKELYKPIQKHIADHYGEFASKFILGNKSMLLLSKGKTDFLKPYQKKLILHTAQEMGLELNVSLAV